MERKEAVEIFFGQIKQAYIDDRKAKGILASGKTDQLFKIQADETGGSLLGPDYFTYQKTGRGPGKFPPIENIIQWIKDKKTFQMTDERGPGLKGLAFAIAKKIAKKGTDIYMRKRPGVDIAQKMLDARKELVNNIADIEKQKVLQSIKSINQN